MKHSPKLLIPIAAFILLAAGVGVFIWTHPQSSVVQSLHNAVQQKRNDGQQDLNSAFSNGKCTPDGPTQLTAAPMKPADVAVIFPLGQVVKGHVTPIDHQYYYPHDVRLGPAAPEVPIFAPAAGTIVTIYRAPEQQVEKHLQPRDGYDILIEHSCRLYTRLGLLTGITTDLAAKLGPIKRGESKSVRIPVTAGQEVARVGGQSLDLTFYDTQTPAKHWIVPTHYFETGKKFATDAFPYFPEALRNELLAKNPRTVEPRGGRFDYDVDGRLIGTWFQQGTNGYQGLQQDAYWRGHASFIPNGLDSTQIMISLGTFDGGTTGYQFSVKGNSPDPMEVSVTTGLVKYELVDTLFLTADGQQWDNSEYAGPIHVDPVNDHVQGVLLVQLLEDRVLKVETFAGKTADDVTGFTAVAKMYER